MHRLAVKRLRLHLRRRNGVHPHHHLRQHFVVGLVLVAVFGALSMVETKGMLLTSVRDVSHAPAPVVPTGVRFIPETLTVRAGDMVDLRMDITSTRELPPLRILLEDPGTLAPVDDRDMLEGSTVIASARADGLYRVRYIAPDHVDGTREVRVEAVCQDACPDGYLLGGEIRMTVLP